MSAVKPDEAKLCEHLKALGVETSDLNALNSFLEGYDFLKLGQNINRGNWNSAMMILQRMDAAVKSLGIRTMVQPLKGVRMAVLAHNEQQAKQALSILVGKRVALIKVLHS